jgi:tripartite-type tricarboxylate transporter receptor subunit TctC
VIAPFAAGTDNALRAFAEPLSKRWKQPVVIENRPGAEGMIGVIAFTNARDDHTLFYNSAAAISTLPVTHKRLPYDPDRDLVPISSVVDVCIALASPASLNIASLADLVDLARARPGKLNYFPTNGGSFSILLPGLVKSEGLDMIEVNYREASLGVQDLVAGRIHLMMASLFTTLPLQRSGKARLLAVTNRQRSPLVPDVPTAIEAGYPQVTFEGLQGFFGPRDIPIDRQHSIAADVRAVAADPAVADLLAAVGQIARGSTPAEFAAEIKEQRTQMEALAKLANIRPMP